MLLNSSTLGAFWNVNCSTQGLYNALVISFDCSLCLRAKTPRSILGRGFGVLIQCKDVSEHEGNPSGEGLTPLEREMKQEQEEVYGPTKSDRFLSKLIPLLFCKQRNCDSDYDAFTYTLVQWLASTPPSDSRQPEQGLFTPVTNPHNNFLLGACGFTVFSVL